MPFGNVICNGGGINGITTVIADIIGMDNIIGDNTVAIVNVIGVVWYYQYH